MVKPTLDIVVVNYKTYDLVQAFLDSLDRHPPSTVDFSVFLVDNESDEAQLSKLRTYGATVLASSENLKYGKGSNWGASQSDSNYIAIFNSDVALINDSCIDQCIQIMEEMPDVGVVGPRQVTRKQTPRKITTAGIVGTHSRPHQRNFGQNDAGQHQSNEEVLMVMGSALFIRRAAWNKILNDPIYRGHYPEALGAMLESPLYFEDTTLCYAMPRFGYKVFYAGEALLVHRHHKTIERFGDSKAFFESRRMFRELMDEWGIDHD